MACQRPPPSTSESTPASAPSPPKLPAAVILVTIDTLRADRLGCYGHGGIETPFIDRIAADGIRFEQAVAQAPMTLPSHCSILTGAYPAYTGVHDQAGFTLKPDLPTLAEILKSAGYQTAAFVASSILNSQTGLGRGFDRYSDLSAGEDVERRADQVMTDALQWIAGAGPQKFFVWIHLFDPHAPYAPPEPFRSRYRASPYDGEIAFVDSVVGSLTRALVDAGRYDGALIAVTGDHGESLGEHGEKTHGLFLYDSTLRVPLILKAPQSQWKGRVVSDQVRSIDIAPTILQLLALPQAPRMQGNGLLSMVAGKWNRPPLVAYSETYYPYYHFQWSPLVAVRTEQYKYIVAPRRELYDSRNDPQETRNIATGNSSIATQMEETAQRYATFGADTGSIPAMEKLDRATLERLRSLGYLGVSAGKARQADLSKLPDPKDRIEVYNLLQEALSDAREGRVELSTAKLLRVVRQDDRLVEAHLNLGANYAQGGQYERAVRALRRALELDDTNVTAAYDLALCYAQQGRLGDAVQGFQRTLSLDPNDSRARVALGRAYQLQGKLDDAIEAFRKALEQNAGLTQAREFLSQAYDAKGWKEAAAAERLRAGQPPPH